MTPLVNLDLAALQLAAGAFEPDGRPTDPHRAEASKMFGVPYDAVTRAQREYAKQAAYRAAYSAPAVFQTPYGE